MAERLRQNVSTPKGLRNRRYYLARKEKAAAEAAKSRATVVPDLTDYGDDAQVPEVREEADLGATQRQALWAGHLPPDSEVEQLPSDESSSEAESEASRPQPGSSRYFTAPAADDNLGEDYRDLASPLPSSPPGSPPGSPVRAPYSDSDRSDSDEDEDEPEAVEGECFRVAKRAQSGS